eukprot:CAMPEP_0172578600 /NCGR_PEP_ID=MMETSP1067-20121228/138819_1 /TAXON_ID=265564 ORGANISM="Thalassiosira punctigera, Strain Tpunct2005C2" /NCGR_SAMPLE_ID=MMETSP1067 /ASSEMBLY_ACC=CAM_ASM_000444 /LENGTH=81 /DNA_ID=CAMNT_0013371299 /DNA_START=124 /DNA_END=366 /DNA_ORIENTATION=-
MTACAISGDSISGSGVRSVGCGSGASSIDVCIQTGVPPCRTEMDLLRFLPVSGFSGGRSSTASPTLSTGVPPHRRPCPPAW